MDCLRFHFLKVRQPVTVRGGCPFRVASFLSLLLLLGAAPDLISQTSNGSIRGRVTDPSEAIIRGATVELTSTERGTVSKSATNEAGLYLFATVQPGDYRITVQKQGFKQSQLAKVSVDVGANVEENFRLDPGSIREEMTVVNEANTVDTLSLWRT
jgi:hypothetical protein